MQKHGGLDVVPLLPKAALACRLTIIREVIFSGFQLELYTAEERIFAYWYATQILETHLSCLDSMIAVVPHGEQCALALRIECSSSMSTIDSTAYQEMVFQRNFITALQLMSMAMFVVSFTDHL
jgi:N-alpha-acetyltransferase 35, NatC auxiliary subunit